MTLRKLALFFRVQTARFVWVRHFIPHSVGRIKRGGTVGRIRIQFPRIPLSTRSKAWVYGRSLPGIAGSNPARGVDVFLLGVLFVIR